LKINDIDFKASTVRVDESSDQRTNGNIGPCKNAAAYRTVVLHGPEGKKSMRKLRRLLMGSPNAELRVFRSQRGGPLLETTILNQGLYPALKALGLPQGVCMGFDGDATGDGNLAESTLPSSANKWVIAPTA
jgi:integrase